MKTNILQLTILGFGLALGAVAPVGASAEAGVAADTLDAEVVTVKVENRNWLDMRVYAVIGGAAHRLGNVGSFGSREFKLRKSWVGPSEDVRLVALPIGSRAANYSPSVLVVPGDYVEYRIENSLSLSFVAKY